MTTGNKLMRRGQVNVGPTAGGLAKPLGLQGRGEQAKGGQGHPRPSDLLGHLLACQQDEGEGAGQQAAGELEPVGLAGR